MNIPIRGREDIIAEVLATRKAEIIDNCVEDGTIPEDLTIESVAESVLEIYAEELPDDTKLEDIEPTIYDWWGEIMDAVRESFEPTAREEAMQDIQNETMRNLL